MAAKGIIVDPKQFKIDMSYMTNEQMCKLYQMSNRQFKATCETLKIPPRAASNRVTLAHNPGSYAESSPLHKEYLKGLAERRREFLENGELNAYNRVKTIVPRRAPAKRQKLSLREQIEAETLAEETIEETETVEEPVKKSKRSKK